MNKGIVENKNLYQYNNAIFVLNVLFYIDFLFLPPDFHSTLSSNRDFSTFSGNFPNMLFSFVSSRIGVDLIFSFADESEMLISLNLPSNFLKCA